MMLIILNALVGLYWQVTGKHFLGLSYRYYSIEYFAKSGVQHGICCDKS